MKLTDAQGMRPIPALSFGLGETVDMLFILNGYPTNPEFMPRAGNFLPFPHGATLPRRPPP